MSIPMSGGAAQQAHSSPWWRRDTWLLAIVLVLPLLLVMGLLMLPNWDPNLHNSWRHFQIVSFISLVAFVLGLLVISVTGPVADARTFFVSMALAAISGLFLIHGLATPGVLIPTPNPVIGWSASLSLFCGAIFMTLASLNWSPRSDSWFHAHRQHLWQLAALAYTIYVLMAFAWPQPLHVLSDLAPYTSYSIAALSLTLYLVAGLRFWVAYQYSGGRFEAMAALALVLLAQAVVPMMTAPLWNLSWWLYHIYMLIAVVLALGAIIQAYEQARHFHLAPYFAATSVIAVAFIALVLEELATRLLGPLIATEDMGRLRWGTTGLFVGGSLVLLIILLRIVRRGDRLLHERAAMLQAQRATLERARMAEALVPISLAMGATLDLDRVLDAICEESLHLFDVDSAFLWLREGNELVGRAGRGNRREAFIGLRHSMSNTSTVGVRVVSERKPLIVNQAGRSPRANPELVERFDVHSVLGVPLMGENEVLGALMLIDAHQDDRFTSGDAEVATIFGQQAAMAITHARLYDRIQQQAEALTRALSDVRTSYQVTLKALSTALDARDRETEGHSQRVTVYALTLARELGIRDARTLEAIEWGALLHDVGKIGVPDAILHKPGKLTTAEWAIMRRHTQVGAQILHGISFLEDASVVVLYHHEWWDGRGYPHGLQGEEIPVPARVFAVADALDAITTTRPYRSARSFVEARSEILDCRGSQFAPAVVDAFAKIPASKWEDLAQQTSSRVPLNSQLELTKESRTCHR